MFDCERCQALVLEHLYGLLEPDEARAFEAHVAGCPDCTAAADRARSWQQRLAQAAKAEFPGVTFT
ncbi:MAG TPA: zf-HC2 domain-containing protein, partial [Gemmataceae bacterium]